MKETTLKTLEKIGFTALIPLIKLLMWDEPKKQIVILSSRILLPAVAIALFLILWAGVSSQINTSLGQLPGPAQVWEQSTSLITEHQLEQEKKAAFYERQEARNAKKLAINPDAIVRVRTYTGAPTFIDQIFTSIITVIVGFLIASFIAIPLGIFCGLSEKMNNALNPIFQIFKPVSPLAWLPIVTMVVSAVYVTDDPMFAKSFVISAITVSLCCLWPTLLNTTVGVASVESDLINVSRVLRLHWFTHTIKIVVPSSIPMMFTGLRLSMGTGWMVLIATEMLAQNPGLGKFVWDEFQNGSSNSLGRIMVAVLVIGLIGFILDRLLMTAQRFVSWDKNVEIR
ncbi:nitrate/nitrite transport system permease protein [Mariprofundus micogutta]|uniref:Nitrate/nitrite transport system permease protein n=1 Tax=Mariprofundus micogutta TaxID=1921010 RepID=A0A1L8CQC1_9PROT|nr:ABC transporter permease [Mariprofundus micogutta]GAV21126.1 nitrate/nitrite transport system permease protein [Mariprofundus micogutta]